MKWPIWMPTGPHLLWALGGSIALATAYGAWLLGIWQLAILDIALAIFAAWQMATTPDERD